MKKTLTSLSRIIILLLLCFGYNFSLKAQVASGYTFAGSTSDTVTLGTPPLNLPINGGAMAGGTALASGGPGSGTTDNIFPNVPIGFEFKFNGKSYSSIGVSSNGFVWFGSTNPNTNEYNPISDNFGADGVISVYGASLQGRNYVSKSGSGPFSTPESAITYQTIGTSPNQIFLVSWNNFTGKSSEDTLYNDTTMDYNNYRMDLWLVLYQCSNVIEPLINSNLYPWFQLGNNTVQVAAECGLRGATSADFYNTSASCQTPTGGVFPQLAPSAPTGSNSTKVTSSTATCLIGTIYGTPDFSSPVFFDIEGGNPQAWIYTPPPFKITSATATPTTACNGVPVTVTVNASGGTAPFSETWTASGTATPSPASGSNSAPITTFPDNSISTSFTSAGTGSFNFTYTDSVGCTATGTAGPVTITSCTSDTITTGAIVGGPFCGCGSFTVPFTSVGTFNAGNVYTVQLSDSSGSFAVPVTIGHATSTTNDSTITVTIPCSAFTSNDYQVRVISSNPGVVGNGVPVSITGTAAPSINILVSATQICSGEGVSSSATPLNAINPQYQWMVNGQTAGTDSSGFTTTLNNPNSSVDSVLINCIMTSNTTCINGVVDTSNTVVVIVNSTDSAKISIAASPGTTICAGEQIVFTVTPVNGGPSPTYQWFIDGVAAGVNSDTISSTTLKNGDSVYCVLTSSNFCANPGTGTSNKLGITITPPATPTLTISASQTTICIGGSITFTPTPVNGGTSPSYEWQVNGVPVSDTTIFTTATLNDSDVVNCVMTSNYGCLSTPTATSNSISIGVITAPVLTISPASPIIECTGTMIQMTVTGADTYLWSPSTGLSCINCSNPVLNALNSTIYTVTGTINNCVASDSVAVVVRCPGNFIPGAFSPNGDNINDVLSVLGPPISNFDFKIFNRWGELVFETNDQNFGWDGTYKSVKAPMGVYVWAVGGIDKTGNKVLIEGKNSGNVTLIR